MSDSLRPHGLYSPWKSLGQNTGVGSLSLLQGIFPTQGSNPGLPHCRQILYQLSHKGSIGWVRFAKMGISWTSPLRHSTFNQSDVSIGGNCTQASEENGSQIEGATQTIENIEIVLSTPVWCGEPWTNHGRDTLLLLFHICFFILTDFFVENKITDSEFKIMFCLREPSYMVGGNVGWCSHCGKQYVDCSEN